MTIDNMPDPDAHASPPEAASVPASPEPGSFESPAFESAESERKRPGIVLFSTIACLGMLGLFCVLASAAGLWFWQLGRLEEPMAQGSADAQLDMFESAGDGDGDGDGAYETDIDASGDPGSGSESGQSASGSRRGGEMVLPGGMPATLDPALIRDVVTAGYMYEIYSGLVTLSADLDVVPDLAESWEISPDGRTYTFKMLEDARFHDGSLVTADAVAFGIERSCDPATGSVVAEAYLGDILGCADKLAGKTDLVQGVSVPDALTLVLEIDAPKSYFLSKLTYPTAFALDPLQVEGNPDWVSSPKGSGPFRLASFLPDEEIVLERHEGYKGAGQVPYLDRVLYDLRPVSAVTRYENGEIDATPVGLADVERVRDPLNPLSAEVVTGPGDLGISYIGFDVRLPPFDDPLVRRAFNMALDKERLARVVMRGMVLSVDGILPPGMPGFREDQNPHRYDPEGAREVLARSRYAQDMPPIVLHSSGAGGADLMSQAVTDEISEVLGIDIAMEQAPWETFQADLAEGIYPMFFLGWSADYADPQDFLDVLFHSQSPLNHGGYANPAVDALLEAARIERDEAARFDLYAEAERAILEDAPWIPLYTGVETWLVAPYVHGFDLPPIVLPRMSRVWLDTR
jgi:oligopeptide transport system substrate-binding protein